MYGAGHVMDMLNRLKNNELMRQRRGKYLKSWPLYKDIRKKGLDKRQSRMTPDELREFGERVSRIEQKILRRNLTILSVLTLIIIVGISMLFLL